jgi:lysine 2,3-aminomutase
VGCCGPTTVVDDALAYLRSASNVREVIFSGGDPLLLPDDQLHQLLAAVRSIPHVALVRIHSRIPVTLPQRITSSLCRLLKRYHPLYLTTHFNHPREITPVSAKACRRLADAGIPLGNQTVLLQGINDDLSVMTDLLQRLLTIRVKPYYLHQLDLVRGTGHFRTPLNKGLAIMRGLRSHISGLATPYFVIDLPGGKGKVPLLPEQVHWHHDHLEIKTYQGETVSYPLHHDDIRVLQG